MKRGFLSILIVLLMASGNPAMGADGSAGSVSKEYRIRAAYLYNFLKGVQWPDNPNEDRSGPLVIGVVGEHAFGDVLDKMATKTIRNREILIKYLDLSESEGGKKAGFSPKALQQLTKCHLLFISKSEKSKAPAIIKFVALDNVLTVSEFKGFTKRGGIINFVDAGTKGGFEVNLKNARKKGFIFPKDLLRLAEKVIE